MNNNNAPPQPYGAPPPQQYQSPPPQQMTYAPPPPVAMASSSSAPAVVEQPHEESKMAGFGKKLAGNVANAATWGFGATRKSYIYILRKIVDKVAYLRFFLRKIIVGSDVAHSIF
jgi:hypothetical protein